MIHRQFICSGTPRGDRRSVRAFLIAAAVIALFSLSSSACSSQPQESTAAGSDQPAASAPAADSGAQTVSGKAPPAPGGAYPAIVVLEPIGATQAAPQPAPPAMDQQQQTFIPSILLVRTGQPVDFLNHDDVLHNVRVKNEETKASSFNVAIPTGEKYTHTFNSDGFYDVGCDIHPGMSAQIMSSSSPYMTVADPSGAFSIPDVPNGPYTAVAYAGAQKIAREINVAAGAATVDLSAP